MRENLGYRGTLTRDLIRERLRPNKKNVKITLGVGIACVIPFVLAGAWILYTGSLMGLAFMFGPAAIIALFYYFQRRQYEWEVKCFNSFEQGRFDLKEMTLTDKDSRTSRDSDGDKTTTYYFHLQQEDGRYSTRVSVSWEEYVRASKGDIYYVLLINGVSVLQFEQKYYEPDAELQAILDGQKPAADPTKAGEPEPAAKGPEAEQTFIDPKQILLEEEQARAKARRAIWLYRGLLVYLAAYGIAALCIMAKGDLRLRFAALPDKNKIPIILAAFALLWAVVFVFRAIRRKCLKGMKLKRETDGELIQALQRGATVSMLLFWLEHVLMFFLLWSWMK